MAALKPPLPQHKKNLKTFVPEKIYIEKNAKNTYLAKQLQEKFPQAEFEPINYAWEYIKNNKFNLPDLKKPYIFVVKERWDFIKPCPCTKNHIGCNYWILNLGFGCPYDCSYCFLQQYANFPGIMLPANLDDFFGRFDELARKIKFPIRIGTGEFCDSLALDNITNYSNQLINFFRKKEVFFELKTKSNNIENILKTKSAKNIIISWSINPQAIIDTEEFTVATLNERVQAAGKIQAAGYSLAFHFDPIIHTPNWQKLYQQAIGKLYENLKPPFKWISLGTLRGTRKLKNVAEMRFANSNIFYGELLLGSDKKLRYPNFLRKEIFKFIYKTIRSYDQNTPVYLCMEDKDCWGAINTRINSSSQAEQYLLGKDH